MKITLIFACVITGGLSGLLTEFQPNTEVYYYRERIRVVTELLQEHCPEMVVDGIDHFPIKRSLIPHLINIHVERRHLERALNALSLCLQRNTTTVVTKPKTTFAPTTQIPVPAQCTFTNTKNLTQPWRKELGNKNMQGGDDEGEIDEGRVWFRFTGEAGSMLLNRCPPHYSCGSDGPYWSDDAMPTGAGETISFVFYKSSLGLEDDASKCKVNEIPGIVTRCSDKPGDLIYRLDGELSSDDAVCGMDAV